MKIYFLWICHTKFFIKHLLGLGCFSLSFGRFRDLRFVRTAELLAGKLPLQPHEYQDVIQKHCMEARQILLNKSVSGLRIALCHSVIKIKSSLKWKLVSSLGWCTDFADFSLTPSSILILPRFHPWEPLWLLTYTALWPSLLIFLCPFEASSLLLLVEHFHSLPLKSFRPCWVTHSGSRSVMPNFLRPCVL